MRADDALPQLTSEQWQQLQSLFAAACDLPAAERTAFVAQSPGGDAIRRHLAGMLDADAGAAPRLQRVVREAARGAAPGDPWVGRRFGAYRVVREIGRGGMGVV